MKITLLVTAGLTVAFLGAAHAGAKPAAKITPAQAKAAAVKKIPGKALSAKYEFEDGHWQYAVVKHPSEVRAKIAAAVAHVENRS